LHLNGIYIAIPWLIPAYVLNDPQSIFSLLFYRCYRDLNNVHNQSTLLYHGKYFCNFAGQVKTRAEFKSTKYGKVSGNLYEEAIGKKQNEKEGG